MYHEYLDVRCGRNQLYVEFLEGDVLALPDGGLAADGKPVGSAYATCPMWCAPSARCAGSGRRAEWCAWR